MRLVPDQEPAKISRLFSEHVRRFTPPGVAVEVGSVHGAEPVLIDIRGPIADAAMSALEDVFGARPVRVREGGSIPIVAVFSQVLGAPTILMGFGLPDDRLHAPNEKFDIEQFHKGIGATVRLLDLVAQG
jgi:acetylornithine deacetylase/succinyl-diaminopimelate desuccinylase-like protein